LRYGGQLALLAVLGIAADRATSSFSAAERSPVESNTASAAVNRIVADADRIPAESRYENVLALRKEGKYAEALAVLDKLIATQPGDALGYLYRAELEADCGLLDEALGDAKLASNGHRNDATLHACQARIYLAKGDYAQARNECEHILKYGYQNADLLYLRSQALTGLKQYALAMADYRSARNALSGSQSLQPSTALAVAGGGLTVDASRGTDRKPRIEIWRDRTDPAPKQIDGGPAAALAPSGQTLAFSTDKYAIKIVDLNGKQPERLLPGTNSPITAMTFCRDGHWLASAAQDRAITVWNLDTGTIAYALDGHTNLITSLAYCPSEDLLGSGSVDQTVRLWSLKEGAWVRTLTGHQVSVNAVAFAPLGRLLASGGADKRIKLWDTSTGAEVSTLEGHSAEITSLAFSRDGRMLASGSADFTWPNWPGQVKLWNTVTGALITTFGGHANGVYKVAFEPESTRLVSAGADFELRSWDVSVFAPTVMVVKK
jgi:tetratricopeptide (TPR) repeat protein